MTVRRAKQVMVLGVCVAMLGCVGGGGESERLQTAEEYCAMFTNGFGPFFYCGTNQANLQVVNFPNGARGYCMGASESLGNVGYSAVTNRGGAFLVTNQTQASNTCSLLANNPFPDNCTTYIRCTR